MLRLDISIPFITFHFFRISRLVNEVEENSNDSSLDEDTDLDSSLDETKLVMVKLSLRIMQKQAFVE